MRALEHEQEGHSSASASTSTRAQARDGQSASRQQHCERHAQPGGHFFNLYVGLHGPGWLYVLGMPPPGCLPIFATLKPEHVPRTSARAHTCAVVFGRALCVLRSREHEKRPATGREKNADVQIYIYIPVLVYMSNTFRASHGKRCRKIQGKW